MASKTFTLNIEPHVAAVGPYEFLFEPEADGAEFVQSYSALKEAQARVTAAGDNVGAEELRGTSTAMRAFLTKFMLPDSAALFAELRIPDRVLVQLLEWIASIYGGGSGARPTGQSSDSSQPSPTAGTSGSDG